MLAAVYWFLIVSSQYIGAQNPNTSIGRENHSCLPAGLQLCISSSMHDHIVQWKGLLMWELTTSQHVVSASLPSISPGFFNQPVAVNLPTFRH